MPIRQATYADLLPASKFLAAAFTPDTLFGEFIHPFRDTYPDDTYLFFLRQLRLDLCSASSDDHLIVCYTTDKDGNETCVTGLAHWIRKRANPPKQSLYTRATLKAIQSYNYAESLVWANRAMEPTRANVLVETECFTKHHYTGTRAEVWYLSLLGVDPAQGKQGLGRALVHYGFDRAKEEGVGCSVISAHGRENFYRHCGFDVIVGRLADEGGEENALRNVHGGTVHFWDNGIKPEGIKKYGDI